MPGDRDDATPTDVHEPQIQLRDLDPSVRVDPHGIDTLYTLHTNGFGRYCLTDHHNRLQFVVDAASPSDRDRELAILSLNTAWLVETRWN